jgi:hypothetical protein
MELSPSQEAVVLLLKNPSEFMQLKGSLPLSQEPSTCSYPEPDQFSPHHPILYLQDPS